MKRFIALLVTVPVLTLASFAVVGPGTTSAAPSPTPNGCIGAANMVNTHAQFGMFNAMGFNGGNGTGNGNAGMFIAVDVSGGEVTNSGSCVS